MWVNILSNYRKRFKTLFKFRDNGQYDYNVMFDLNITLDLYNRTASSKKCCGVLRYNSAKVGALDLVQCVTIEPLAAPEFMIINYHKMKVLKIN